MEYGAKFLAILYVASDRPGVGKTALCAALAHELRQHGKNAAVFKPVAASAGDDPDVAAYRELLGQSQAPEGPADVETSVAQLAERNDVVLVEGTSSAADNDAAKLTEALDAKVIAVARYGPDLDADDLAAFKATFGDRLIGFVVNSLTRYQGTSYKTELAPSIQARGLVPLGAIFEDRRLLGVTVGDLATHLDATYLNVCNSDDALVEHVMVGGMGLDSGEMYFGLRQHKAVVVRGDRPDIQMSALATPTACMVLANGIEPIEYVLNEAAQEEVPLISVQTDTLGTMESMNGLLDRARFDHPAKLERFVELLDEHVDTAAIYSAVGLTQ